jgi:cation diffusion facilitator CzcD-associated flavoprotein CzcO
VALVTEPIAEVTATGIRTADGAEHPVDAIILATGFRATEFVSPLRVHGRDGRELSELWKQDAASYLGISVAGFPNFFLLVGPNTGLGHSSIVFMIEAQVRYVISAIKAARKNGWRRAEVREEAQGAFTGEIQRRLESTAWQSGCRSFYLSANGRNYMMWPGSTVEYWRRTRRFDSRAYVCR